MRQSLVRESIDSGVKEKQLGKPQAHLAGLDWRRVSCGRQAARAAVETDRARVYCPAGGCTRRAARGGGGGSGGNSLFRAQGMAGEGSRHMAGCLLRKNKWDMSKGCPVPKRTADFIPALPTTCLATPPYMQLSCPCPEHNLVARWSPVLGSAPAPKAIGSDHVLSNPQLCV